eukprot:6112848-Prymnesium_polylepis.1
MEESGVWLRGHAMNLLANVCLQSVLICGDCRYFGLGTGPEWQRVADGTEAWSKGATTNNKKQAAFRGSPWALPRTSDPLDCEAQMRRAWRRV